MEFGELHIIDHTSVSEFYHIHVVRQDHKEWKVGDIISTFDFPERVFNVENEYLKFDKERRFEIIRTKKYPDYPSRYKCLFAIKIDYLDFWKSEFQNRRCYFTQIAKIQLIDGKWIQLNDAFFDEHERIPIEELAEGFWSGDDFMEDAKPIILFEGEFKIVDVQNYFQNY